MKHRLPQLPQTTAHRKGNDNVDGGTEGKSRGHQPSVLHLQDLNSLHERDDQHAEAAGEAQERQSAA